jgi:signal transduction histidine kinase
MPQDAPWRRQLDEILQAASLAEELTRRLMAIGRRGTGRTKVIELGALVTRLQPLLKRLLVDIELVLELRASAVFDADPVQLEQLIVNLASNARDAMPAGGQLTIATEDRELAEPLVQGTAALGRGHYVVLEVRDTGTGMDATTRRRVFEPFFTTKTAGHGTGLGLPTVLSIVHDLAGAIEIESEPGLGTTFRVYFPSQEP